MHAPEGVCFIIGDTVFTGDTLLPSGVGRIDLPGGDAAAMNKSIALLRTLPPSLTAYPGHGPSMPLGELLLMIEEKRAD